MTEAINQRIAAIITQVAAEQKSHLEQPGVGRYKQYPPSEPEVIDGYTFQWSVDEFLGQNGVGCIFRFTTSKNGQTWQLIDGHGPGYVEGPESDWQEIINYEN